MAECPVWVLQKEVSPYGQLLARALSILKLPLVRVTPQVLREEWLQRGPAMLVWDICGFEGVQLEQITCLLTAEELGVVLLGREFSGEFSTALAGCRIRQVLLAPRLAKELAAGIEIGIFNHQRICLELSELRLARELFLERALVEQAKTVLMKSHGLSESQAMREMQHHSRNTNQKLVRVAEYILQAQPMFLE